MVAKTLNIFANIKSLALAWENGGGGGGVWKGKTEGGMGEDGKIFQTQSWLPNALLCIVFFELFLLLVCCFCIARTDRARLYMP